MIRALLSAITAAVGALGAPVAAVAPAPTAGACIQRCAVPPPPVRVTGNGYVYSYDRAGRFFVGVQRFGVSGGGRPYDVAEVIDCGVVAPPAPGAPAPPGALDCVRARCQVGARVGRWIVVFVRPARPPGAPWRQLGRRCAVSTPNIPLRAVDTAAAEHLRRTVGAAVPVVEPGELTLVAFPTIVSTVDPGPLQFAITLPLPGMVAVAPSFAWSFTDPDGSVTTAVGAGRAFDGTAPGVTGHYLTHEFAEAGVGTVSVTETWTGTVTVEGVGPVALDPLVLTRAVQLVVKENRPVLVGN